MFKISKKKVIIILVAIATVIGISTQTLFILQKTHTKEVQTSNIKEKNPDNIIAISKKNIEDNKSEDTNMILNEDNTNKQEDTKPQLENINNTNINQEVDSFKEEKKNNNINQQKVINTQPETTINTNIQLNTGVQLNEEKSNISTVPEEKTISIYYDRTTSIYDNDNITLLRREYYLNNKLTYYSVVEQFESTTKSYIEKIYKCNLETNIDPLVRTDVYINGSLAKSY